MNFTNTHRTAHIPGVYIAAFTGDGHDSIRRQLLDVLTDLESAAVSDPGTLVFDNADYGRFDTEALNTFLVDTGADAVIWGDRCGPETTFHLHAAIAPFPKVAHACRKAARFSARVPLPLDNQTVAVVIAQILGAALAEVARNRPVPRQLIDRCVRTLEPALSAPLECEIHLNVLETLAALEFARAGTSGGLPSLHKAIAHSTRASEVLGTADGQRCIDLLKVRARMLTRLGHRTRDRGKIIAAIRALKNAAPHVDDHVGLAQLDMLLAECNMQLGLMGDNRDMLKQARDLLKWVLPFFYRNLAVEDWAAAQARLAEVSWALMQRTPERAPAKGYADEALGAAHEALTFYNATAFPHEWARITAHLDEMLHRRDSMSLKPRTARDLQRRFSSPV
jgi:hypothetical protein